MPLIKNCGLKTIESIDCAVASGANFVGFVHCEPSPRHVTLEQMGTLITHTNKRVKTVAVLVNPDDLLLHKIMQNASPDYIQVHEVDSPYRIDEIKALCRVGVITAISVDAESNFNHAKFMAFASDYILYDAKHPGGGVVFDWSILKNHAPVGKPWFLAGGLTISNVAEAIRITGAPMVDVSSGIESSRGEKSEEMIAAFNAAVLNASV